MLIFQEPELKCKAERPPPPAFQAICASERWLRSCALQAVNDSEGKEQGTHYTGAQAPVTTSFLTTPPPT